MDPKHPPLPWTQYLASQTRLLLLLTLLAAFAVWPAALLFRRHSWGLILGLLLIYFILIGLYLLLDYRRIRRTLEQVQSDLDAGLRHYSVPNSTAIEHHWLALLESQALRDRQELHQSQHTLRHWEEDVTALVHDVKTPLAAARLILEDPETPDLESLRGSLHFLERRVTQILYYVKSRDLSRDYRIRSVELFRIVSRSLANMAPYLVQHRVRIETQGLYTQVQSDPKWLEFILQNLIENAVNHSDQPEPQLTFMSAPVPNQRATDLFVIDDGPGIPADERPHIFKRGFTGHLEDRKQASTGLGLYLVRTLADPLSIAIEFVPPELLGLERGAVFRLRFFDEAYLTPATDPDQL